MVGRERGGGGGGDPAVVVGSDRWNEEIMNGSGTRLVEAEFVRRFHRHEDIGINQCSSTLIKHIRAPVHLVWSLVRRFDQPQKYKPFISTCVVQGGENLEIGSVREVNVKSGLPATTSMERLELLDDDEHVFSIKIVGGDHRLRIMAAPTPPNANVGDSSSDVARIKGRRPDVGWKYNFLADEKNPNIVTCMFCSKATSGGIYRAKQHQIGGFRNANPCTKCPPEVRDELEEAMNTKNARKAETFDVNASNDFGNYGLGDDDIDEVVASTTKRVNIGGMERDIGKRMKKNPRCNTKGPMDLYTNNARSNDRSGGSNMRQTSINDACDKEMRVRTNQYIARFFYQAGIAFNVARMDAFKDMVGAIGSYGPNLKPPSYHELRVPLLNKELEYTNDLMKGHKEQWTRYGCSIMSDGWTDRRGRTLINFLVNCSLGTMFVESVDASSFVKTGEKIFELLDKFVESIGEGNVIQVITDNGSNFKMAGELLMAKRKSIYWTPCAAHCLDLVLEDIGKIKKIGNTIRKAVTLTGFIYNHSGVLSMMRKFNGNKELVRFGITRFATSFLCLQSLHKQKNYLRAMFTSEEWVRSRWAREIKGKKACDTVLMASFWNNVTYILKVMGPLVRVLRLVDGDKRPAMGYIYEAMDRAKEAIEKAFNENEEKYKDIFAIIDKRWECQLHQPLHAAGHFLNPQFFYNDRTIEHNVEVTSGLYKCVERLLLEDEQAKAMDELTLYTKAEGQFGINLALKSRETKSPAEWWSLYGNSAPILQKFAIKILSLTCSASGCERNWSVFEHIHSKRRNRLEHERLQKLVFIKYNQKLKDRFKRKDLIDPISLEDIDDSNEWMTGFEECDTNAEDELVFEDDTLTWGNVQRASGAGERTHMTRQHAKAKGKEKYLDPRSTSNMRSTRVEHEDVNVTFDDNLEEEDLDYNSKEDDDYEHGLEEEEEGEDSFDMSD